MVKFNAFIEFDEQENINVLSGQTRRRLQGFKTVLGNALGEEADATVTMYMRNSGKESNEELATAVANDYQFLLKDEYGSIVLIYESRAYFPILTEEFLSVQIDLVNNGEVPEAGTYRMIARRIGCGEEEE